MAASRALRSLWILLFLCLGLAASCRSRDAHRQVRPAADGDTGRDNSFAFVDVTVVPFDRERVIPGQTVLVRNGKIAAIGDRDEIEVPPGLESIDGRGRYLMPGLADMHVHLTHEDFLLLLVANGVTTVRNMVGNEQVLQWRKSIESGTRLGPRIFTAGPLNDGDPPIWPGSRTVTTAAEADRAVAEQKAAGYDSIKVYARLGVPAYQGLVTAAHERGLRVVGHVPDAVGLDRALAAKQDSVEHLTGYLAAVASDGAPTPKHPILGGFLHHGPIDAERLTKLARRTAGAGVWNCVTLIVLRKLVPAEIATEWLAHPEMKYVAPAVKTTWNPAEDFRLKSLDPGEWRALRAGDADRMQITAALHGAGARLLLGTDTPNPFVIPGFSVHEELRLLVTAGLSPYEALRTATRNPAEFVGEAAEWGTVAVGRRADLVLVERNPLDDVGHVSRRVGVMARGVWYPQSTLDARLEALAASYRETETQPTSPPGPGG